MPNQRGFLALPFVIASLVVLAGVIGGGIYLVKSQPLTQNLSEKTEVAPSIQPVSSIEPKFEPVWLDSERQYQYAFLPNGTKVAKLLFTNSLKVHDSQPLSVGQRVMETLIIGHLFGNPNHHAGESIYNQNLYESKTNPVYQIKVQDFFNQPTIYFNTQRPPINIAADLSLNDNNLRTSPEVEGVLAQLSEDSIIAFIHYKVLDKRLEDYKKDQKYFLQTVETYKLEEWLRDSSIKEKLLEKDLIFGSEISTPSPTPTPLVQINNPSEGVNCSVNFDPKTGSAPLSVKLIYGASYGGGFDNYVTNVQWDWNSDDIWDTDLSVKNQHITHIFDKPGTYTVKLRLQTKLGQTSDVCNGTISIN